MDDQLDQHRYQDYKHLKQKKMQYSLQPVAVALTHKSKFLYPLFNLFELEVNRFRTLPEFAKLTSEITAFNEELDEWKKKNKDIKNIFLTYHLYQNLFSRMKYISSLVIDRGQAKKGYQEIVTWFFEQKPKIRNKVPEKEQGKLKPSTADRETDIQMDSLLVTSSTKRELKVYQAMARTTHTQFYPPKERLLEYKRKDLMQGFNNTNKNDATHQRRVSSMTNLSKGMTRYRGSFATTRTSFVKTVTTGIHKVEEKVQPIVVPFQLNEQKDPVDPVDPAVEQALEQLAKEKQVQQQDILQQNIVQVVNQQDQADGEEDVFSQQQKKDNRQKMYVSDSNTEDDIIAEQRIKDIKQSTLRRILKDKQQAVRCKLEQLKIAQQMGNWAAVKGRQNAEERRKLQRMQLANKYTKLEFVPTKFEERQSSRKRDIPAFQVLYRSKSFQSLPIEESIQKLKINNALKTYSKYINHIEIKPIEPQNEQQKAELKAMRATSLTSFCRQGKKAPFSSLLDRHGVQNQNEEAMEHMILIKDRLAKTAIPIQKKQVLRALGVVDVGKMDLIDQQKVYPPQKTLFSNPFFPKHLYQTKPKKKKN